MIKKLPLPIAGVMLALVATGNLLSSYGQVYRNLFGLLAFAVFLLLLAKILLRPESIAEAWQNPLLASVMPTFSMGLMLLSVHLNPYIPPVAYFIWLLGLILHAVMIVVFTMTYILHLDLKKVYPSYFIVYVGIVCASVTAPAFGMAHLGRILFWFGFISFLALLPVTLYRTLFVKEIPAAAMPAFAIYTAPANLCLAGYLNSFDTKNILIIGLLGGLSLALFIAVIVRMPRLLKLPFFPSYSAFTFPFVITASAAKATASFLASQGMSMTFSAFLVHILELWAVIMVVYVSVRYVNFLLAKPETVILRGN